MSSFDASPDSPANPNDAPGGAPEDSTHGADAQAQNGAGQNATEGSSQHDRSIGSAVRPLDGRASGGQPVHGIYLGEETSWNADANNGEGAVEPTGRQLVGWFSNIEAVDADALEDVK